MRVICAVCRRSRTKNQIAEGRAVCIDRASCFKAMANRMESPSRAQSEAKRISDELLRAL